MADGPVIDLDAEVTEVKENAQPTGAEESAQESKSADTNNSQPAPVKLQQFGEGKTSFLNFKRIGSSLDKMKIEVSGQKYTIKDAIAKVQPGGEWAKIDKSFGKQQNKDKKKAQGKKIEVINEVLEEILSTTIRLYTRRIRNLGGQDLLRGDNMSLRNSLKSFAWQYFQTNNIKIDHGKFSDLFGSQYNTSERKSSSGLSPTRLGKAHKLRGDGNWFSKWKPTLLTELLYGHIRDIPFKIIRLPRTIMEYPGKTLEGKTYLSVVKHVAWDMPKAVIWDTPKAFVQGQKEGLQNDHRGSTGESLYLNLKDAKQSSKNLYSKESRDSLGASGAPERKFSIKRTAASLTTAVAVVTASIFVYKAIPPIPSIPPVSSWFGGDKSDNSQANAKAEETKETKTADKPKIKRVELTAEEKAALQKAREGTKPEVKPEKKAPAKPNKGMPTDKEIQDSINQDFSDAGKKENSFAQRVRPGKDGQQKSSSFADKLSTESARESKQIG